ncbi:MAG TPA: tetratricopeptide repeat protein, partial [Myxococcota bacterium]
MSSKEQALAFHKHRDADDKGGNLAWASKVGSRALKASATGDVEGLFELGDIERIVWRLLRLPRRYTELEHAGLFDADTLRSVLRGFVAADVVEVVDAAQAKALLPAEIKRLRTEVAGKQWRPSVGTLSARVYRPDIGIEPQASSSPGEHAQYVEQVPSSSMPPSSAPAPGPVLDLSAEEQALKQQLVGAAQAMATQNHYAFIGVRQGADDGAIRNAYVALARDYHPDRIQGSKLIGDPEVVAAVDVLFKRLNDANKAIGNVEARARYDRELALQESSSSVPTSATPGRQRRPVEARNAYAMAETFFKRKDFKQAEVHYRQAISFDGEEPMLQVALAWCLFLNPELPEETRIGEARRRLDDLVKKTKNGDAYYKLGRVLREAGEEAAAIKCFENAVKLSPGHIDAQREVRLVESRRERD